MTLAEIPVTLGRGSSAILLNLYEEWIVVPRLERQRTFLEMTVLDRRDRPCVVKRAVFPEHLNHYTT